MVRLTTMRGAAYSSGENEWPSNSTGTTNEMASRTCDSTKTWGSYIAEQRKTALFVGNYILD
jgi:hypothetical protein